MGEPQPSEVLDLLTAARAARQGRDLWRAVGPVLVSLREAGVHWQTIEDMTGIKIATAHRVVRSERRSRTSDRASSEAES